jgi:pantoate--beta-alanine ligase
MARDLDIPTEIVGCPTVREDDGLALSSRNVYLTPAEREAAPALYRALRTLAAAAGDGHDIDEAVESGTAALLKAGFSAVDYLAVVDTATLEPLAKLDRPGRVLGAAKVGAVRLIDNIAAMPS